VNDFLQIDPGSPVPLHRQVYDGIREAILGGKLQAGERLPPTRVLAEDLTVSRQTVTDAYEQLQTEGYLEGRRGAGTFVATTVPDRSAQPAFSPPLSRWAKRLPTAPAPAPPARYDFQPDRLAADVFPWDAWDAAVRHASAEHERLFAPPDPGGHRGLRVAVAEHVRRHRAVPADPERVVIVSGTQQGLNLLALLTLEGGDRAALEDPGYPSARLALEAAGAVISSIPVDAEGIQPGEVDAAGPHRLIYVTPSHQYPTGATLPLGRRLELLEVAYRQQAIIVEDDYDSEFRYEGRPVEALQALDDAGIVVYAGTFSKSLMPGLRLGFLVLPAPLVAPFVAAKAVWDSGTPMMEQSALAAFMESGEYERHIRKMRRVYRARHDALLAALQRYLPHVAEAAPSQGGLSLLVRLNTALDADSIVEHAARAGIAVRAATGLYQRPPDRPALLLGFGGISLEDIDPGIARLAEIIAASRRRP